MEIKFLFQLLIIHLIILAILKVFFALSERPKSKEKPAKAPKPAKHKEVKQDLISKKQLQVDDKHYATQSNLVMFNANAEEESSIDKYLKETKKIAKLEQDRIEKEEQLKNVDNPLHQIDDNNIWLQDELEFGVAPKSMPDSYNAVSPPPRSFVSEFANSNFTAPKNNESYDYHKINTLLNDIEKGNEAPIPLSDNFKSLTREMQIFVITKLINKTFK